MRRIRYTWSASGLSERAIVDTGPLVAFLDVRERHHDWAVETTRRVRGPMLTCEAVLTEAAYLLRGYPAAVESLCGLVGNGHLLVPFDLAREVDAVWRLMKKYRNVPMSLADACVVRMSELFDDHHVFTLDTDFRVYRKHARKAIPVLLPQG